jgi:multiple antibiotic resistance protein
LVDYSVFLNAFTAIIVIVDPVGTALIFNSLAASFDFKKRIIIAAKAVIISGCLLVLFALYGSDILQRLGISIDALRISGGLLLFYTAFKMVTQKLEYQVSADSQDIAVYPMSVPLISGPGSLTLAILLYSAASTPAEQFGVLFALIASCSVTMMCLVLSVGIKKVIGKTGDEILRRFLGVLLAALAIQFVMDGLAGFRG